MAVKLGSTFFGTSVGLFVGAKAWLGVSWGAGAAAIALLLPGRP